MNFQIDQSGKLEHTNRPTIVCLANGYIKTIKITAPEKQKLLRTIKEIEFPKQNYIYKLFAVLIFLIVKKEKIKFLEIDKEYPGNESIIKDTLIHLYSKYEIVIPEISFVLVGKESNCHKGGIAVFQYKEKPNIIIKAEKILEVLYA